MVAVVFAVRPGCPRRLLRRDHPEVVGKAVVRLGGVAIHDGLLAHGRLSTWRRERGADHLQHPPHRDDIGVSVGQRDPVEGDQVAAAAADGLGHLLAYMECGVLPSILSYCSWRLARTCRSEEITSLMASSACLSWLLCCRSSRTYFAAVSLLMPSLRAISRTPFF